MAGAFCKTYGDTIENRILEYILENQELDFAVSDMAKGLGVSKPKAYEVIKDFETKGYIKKSRIIGKTQLYVMNRDNKRIQLFLKDFDECLRIIVEEYSEENEKLAEPEILLANVYVGNRNITRALISKLASGGA
ncbi:MAG: hypothetical protein KJ955_02890 [Nanoarchaeota archaeon]|nr:hypothetical protein [Nanoarchaeota archaeon]